MAAFIVVEGPNGVGKTTVINSLCDLLIRDSFPHMRTKEPTTSELGVYIKKNQNKNSKEVLACLVAANRYEHLETIVYPAINAGKIVVCDRYFPSTLVYQLMDGMELSFVDGLNLRIIVPDLTVFLSADTNILKDRVMERDELTRFERNQEKEARLYEEAKSILTARGWNAISIDTGGQSVSKIADAILSEIKKIHCNR